MKSVKSIPPPGSPEAIAIGCTCPTMDNGNGIGFMGIGRLYVYTQGCAVHDGPPIEGGTIGDTDGEDESS